MTCPREQDLLRLGPSGLGALLPSEARALETHTATCPHCSETLRLLVSTNELLRSTPPPLLDDAARARMWRAIQAEKRSEKNRPLFGALRLPRFVPYAALAAAAAACALLILSTLTGHESRSGEVQLTAGALADASAAKTFSEGDRLPAAVELHATTDAQLRGPGFQLQIAQGADLSFGSEGPERSIFLRTGELQLDLQAEAPGWSFAVYTPAARIESLSARFHLSAGERATELAVERGELRAIVANEAPITLRAGEKRRLERHAAESELDPAQLARRADELRRSGLLEEAAAAYATLARDARGAGYAEEALLRRARILHQLGRAEDALVELHDADERFPSGVLKPERALLSAELLAEGGALNSAASVLEGVDPTLATDAFWSAEVDLARRLVASNPKHARALALRVYESAAPSGVKKTALSIAIDAARGEGDDRGAAELERLGSQ